MKQNKNKIGVRIGTRKRRMKKKKPHKNNYHLIHLLWRQREGSVKIKSQKKRKPHGAATTQDSCNHSFGSVTCFASRVHTGTGNKGKHCRCQGRTEGNYRKIKWGEKVYGKGRVILYWCFDLMSNIPKLLNSSPVLKGIITCFYYFFF